MGFNQFTFGELIFNLSGLAVGVLVFAVTCYVARAHRRDYDKQIFRQGQLDWCVASIALGFVLFVLVGGGTCWAMMPGVLSNGDMLVAAFVAVVGFTLFFGNFWIAVNTILYKSTASYTILPVGGTILFIPRERSSRTY